MPLVDTNRPFFEPLPGEPHRQYSVNTLFTYNIPLHCNIVVVQALTQNIRYTLDGTNPTAASGFRLTAGGDPLGIPITKNMTLKFIAETAGAILQLQPGA